MSRKNDFYAQTACTLKRPVHRNDYAEMAIPERLVPNNIM